MDFGPIRIRITTSLSTICNPVLFEKLTDRFHPFAMAGISLSADDFIEELVKAYFDYVELSLSKSMRENKKTDKNIFEEAEKDIAPLTVDIIANLIANDKYVPDKYTAFVLQRYLREAAEGISGENVYEIKRIDSDQQLATDAAAADDELFHKAKNLLFWGIVAIKAKG